jgi:hypothetical protein
MFKYTAELESIIREYQERIVYLFRKSGTEEEEYSKEFEIAAKTNFKEWLFAYVDFSEHSHQKIAETYNINRSKLPTIRAQDLRSWKQYKFEKSRKWLSKSFTSDIMD